MASSRGVYPSGGGGSDSFEYASSEADDDYQLIEPAVPQPQPQPLPQPLPQLLPQPQASSADDHPALRASRAAAMSDSITFAFSSSSNSASKDGGSAGPGTTLRSEDCEDDDADWMLGSRTIAPGDDNQHRFAVPSATAAITAASCRHCRVIDSVLRHTARRQLHVTVATPHCTSLTRIARLQPIVHSAGRPRRCTHQCGLYHQHHQRCSLPACGSTASLFQSRVDPPRQRRCVHAATFVHSALVLPVSFVSVSAAAVPVSVVPARCGRGGGRAGCSSAW